MRSFIVASSAIIITCFPALAASSSIKGGWVCSSGCGCTPSSIDKATKIDVDAKGKLSFKNECGDVSPGRSLSTKVVLAEKWKVRATISKDGNTLNWSNGSVWIRDERIAEGNCFHIANSGNFVNKTAKELMGSKEAQALGIAICSYYSGNPQDCAAGITKGAAIVNELTKHDGSDYYGIFRARQGYEICRAHFVASDWSVTGDATFNTRIMRTPKDNGLGWYGSLYVGDDKGHWVTTKVVIEEVPAGTVSKYSCTPTDDYPWLCKGADCSKLLPDAKIGLSEGPKCTDIFK